MKDNNKIISQKKNSPKLKDGEMLFRTLFETSRDALMTLNPPSWRFTKGNAATLKMFMAKNEEEFTSAEPWGLSPEKQPDGRLSSDKAKEMIEVAMREGTNFFEWTHRRLNGEDFPATVLLTRVNLNGESFLQATVRDITQQKKAERDAVELSETKRLVNLMVGRELKIIELKKEIKELKEKMRGNK